MSIPAALSVTRSISASGSAGPAASRSDSPESGFTTVANPLNFSEPSGQYASGQVCSGPLFPPAPVSANVWLGRTAPRAQGTPQLTPVPIAGASPSSHRSATPESAADRCAAASCSATALAASIPMAFRLVIFMTWPVLQCSQLIEPENFFHHREPLAGLQPWDRLEQPAHVFLPALIHRIAIQLVPGALEIVDRQRKNEILIAAKNRIVGDAGFLQLL